MSCATNCDARCFTCPAPNLGSIKEFSYDVLLTGKYNGLDSRSERLAAIKQPQQTAREKEDGRPPIDKENREWHWNVTELLWSEIFTTVACSPCSGWSTCWTTLPTAAISNSISARRATRSKYITRRYKTRLVWWRLHQSVGRRFKRCQWSIGYLKPSGKGTRRRSASWYRCSETMKPPTPSTNSTA